MTRLWIIFVFLFWTLQVHSQPIVCPDKCNTTSANSCVTYRSKFNAAGANTSCWFNVYLTNPGSFAPGLSFTNQEIMFSGGQIVNPVDSMLTLNAVSSSSTAFFATGNGSWATSAGTGCGQIFLGGIVVPGPFPQGTSFTWCGVFQSNTDFGTRSLDYSIGAACYPVPSFPTTDSSALGIVASTGCPASPFPAGTPASFYTYSCQPGTRGCIAPGGTTTSGGNSPVGDVRQIGSIKPCFCNAPLIAPTPAPTRSPTMPTVRPTRAPTDETPSPTHTPATLAPTGSPTMPTVHPTRAPTLPTVAPMSSAPTTEAPTAPFDPCTRIFTAHFKLTYGAMAYGYVEGIMVFNYTAKVLAFYYTSQVYQEIYTFNSKSGVGDLTEQSVYRISSGGNCAPCARYHNNWAFPALWNVTGVDNPYPTTTDANGCTNYTTPLTNNNWASYYGIKSDGTLCYIGNQGRLFTLDSIKHCDVSNPQYTTPPEGCACVAPQDVVFSLDRSTSILTQDIYVYRDFLKQFADANLLDPAKPATSMQIAITQWGSISDPVTGMNPIGKYGSIPFTMDPYNFAAAIEQIGCVGTPCNFCHGRPNNSNCIYPQQFQTCSSCGLYSAGLRFVDSQNYRQRNGAARIIIVITDGNTNTLNSSWSADGSALCCGDGDPSTKALVPGVAPNCDDGNWNAYPPLGCYTDVMAVKMQVQQMLPGVQIFAIGIGAYVKVSTLNVIASSPANVLASPDWKTFLSQFQRISLLTCVEPDPIKSCGTDALACGFCNCGISMLPDGVVYPNLCDSVAVVVRGQCFSTQPSALNCTVPSCKVARCIPSLNNGAGGCVYDPRVCDPVDPCYLPGCVNDTCIAKLVCNDKQPKCNCTTPSVPSVQPSMPPTQSPTISPTLSPTAACAPTYFKNANCEFELRSLWVILLIVLVLSAIVAAVAWRYSRHHPERERADLLLGQVVAEDFDSDSLSSENLHLKLEEDSSDTRMRMMEFVSREIVCFEFGASQCTIDKAVESAVGALLWESVPYQRLRAKVAEYSKSKTIRQVLADHPRMTLDQVLSLVYYTSDMRHFRGDKTHSVFWMIRDVLLERNPDIMPKWNPLIALMHEAKTHLPKYSGTVYRGIDKPLSQLSADYVVGNQVHWGTFASTTTNQDVIKEFSKHEGTWMIIKEVVNGIEIPFSLFPKESEVLLYPNMSFKVVNIMTQDMKKLTKHPEGLDIIEFCCINSASEI